MKNNLVVTRKGIIFVPTNNNKYYYGNIFKKISKLSNGGHIDDLGFVVEAGEYRLDFRFSTLVDSSWQNHLSMVSEVLFTK